MASQSAGSINERKNQMKLPNDVKQRADSIIGLTRSEKAQVLSKLGEATDENKNHVITQLLGTDLQTARFVRHVLDKSDIPDAEDAPQNKRRSPPNTL